MPNPKLLRRAWLLCADSTVLTQIDDDGICPVHRSAACALWFIPWQDAVSLEEAASSGGVETP